MKMNENRDILHIFLPLDLLVCNVSILLESIDKSLIYPSTTPSIQIMNRLSILVVYDIFSSIGLDFVRSQSSIIHLKVLKTSFWHHKNFRHSIIHKNPGLTIDRRCKLSNPMIRWQTILKSSLSWPLFMISQMNPGV